MQQHETHGDNRSPILAAFQAMPLKPLCWPRASPAVWKMFLRRERAYVAEQINNRMTTSRAGKSKRADICLGVCGRRAGLCVTLSVSWLGFCCLFAFEVYCCVCCLLLLLLMLLLLLLFSGAAGHNRTRKVSQWVKAETLGFEPWVVALVRIYTLERENVPKHGAKHKVKRVRRRPNEPARIHYTAAALTRRQREEKCPSYPLN